MLPPAGDIMCSFWGHHGYIGQFSVPLEKTINFHLLGFFSIHCTCIINMYFGFLLCRKWSDLKTSHVNGMITCWLKLWRVNKEENLKNSDSKKRKSSKSCRYKNHSPIMKQMIDSYLFIKTFFFLFSPEVICYP